MNFLDKNSWQLLEYCQWCAHMEHLLRQWTRPTISSSWQRIKGSQVPTRWGHKDFPHHSISRHPLWQTYVNFALYGCVWSPTSKRILQSYTHRCRWQPHQLSRKYRHYHRFSRPGQTHNLQCPVTLKCVIFLIWHKKNTSKHQWIYLRMCA